MLFQGIQEVEAFLWALSKVNEKNKQLESTSDASKKGVQIGAVIFDGCSNKEKIVRDLTNLLTGRVQDRIQEMVSLLVYIVWKLERKNNIKYVHFLHKTGLKYKEQIIKPITYIDN